MSISPFQELHYNEPSVSSSDAAKKATPVIKDIFNTVPAALPFILEPSALLLFANLRAESPYHVVGTALDDDQLDKLDAVLAKHDIYRFTETLPAESANPGEEIFSLINPTMLNAIPNQYECVKDIWVPISPEAPFRYAYIEWLLVVERSLAKLMDEGKLPSDWLKDWWAPHNVRFGMQLGYPGEAISSSLWAEAHEREGNRRPDSIEEVIAAEDARYFGARVGFYVAPEVAKKSSVAHTVQLWKEVIAEIYKTFPLAELLSNEEFARSYHKLKLSETGEE